VLISPRAISTKKVRNQVCSDRHVSSGKQIGNDEHMGSNKRIGSDKKTPSHIYKRTGNYLETSVPEDQISSVQY